MWVLVGNLQIAVIATVVQFLGNLPPPNLFLCRALLKPQQYVQKRSEKYSKSLEGILDS